MKLLGLLAVLSWSLFGLAQEVHVSTGKASVALSLPARKPYALLSAEEKTPVLTLQCAHKGKTAMHLLTFTAGNTLVEDDSDPFAKNGPVTFEMTIGGKRQATTWIPYGDAVTYAYYGKTEPERVKFIQTLFGSATVSIEFKPFLTGTATTSVFEVGKLSEEMNQHPECAIGGTK